jgi:addiction module RelE/StbE family toxin
MRIRYHKKFEKRFKKLPPSLKKKTISAIRKFVKDPFDKTLANHPLTGKLLGKRAFSVTGDIRIVFEEYNSYVLVIMLDVGSHSQVYSD